MKSKKITKAIGKKFVEAVKQGLIEMGAKLQPQCKIRKDVYEFKLDTIVGNLNITLRQDQNHLFCVFARFDDVDKAKHKFDCNKFSGKYNFHKVLMEFDDKSNDFDQCVEFALMHFECTQPNEVLA